MTLPNINLVNSISSQLSDSLRASLKSTDLPTDAVLILEQIVGRRTIRRFQRKRVTLQIAEWLVDVASAAPSAHNRQPWRFCFVWNDARKRVLADRMGARLRMDREHDADDRSTIDADVARSRARIVEAPLVVAVCMTMAEMDRYPDQRRTEAERHMAVQSVAMAGQNLLLAAHAMGLGACWMCAPLFCPREVVGALDLPADWEPQGLVLLGYPAEDGRNKQRKLRVNISIDRGLSGMAHNPTALIMKI